MTAESRSTPQYVTIQFAGENPVLIRDEVFWTFEFIDYLLPHNASWQNLQGMVQIKLQSLYQQKAMIIKSLNEARRRERNRIIRTLQGHDQEIAQFERVLNGSFGEALELLLHPLRGTGLIQPYQFTRRYNAERHRIERLRELDTIAEIFDQTDPEYRMLEHIYRWIEQLPEHL